METRLDNLIWQGKTYSVKYDKISLDAFKNYLLEQKKLYKLLNVQEKKKIINREFEKNIKIK